MKTAVCFSGQGRSLEYTHENIQNYLVNKLGDVDTFFNVCEDANSHKIEKYFNPTVLNIEPDELVDEKDYNFYNNIRGTKSQYLMMLKSRKKVNELRLQYEKDNSIEYDYVVSSRMDVKYFNPLEDLEKLDSDYIQVPDFHGFSCVQGNGYNDRFAIGNSKNMTVYFDLFDSLIHYSNLGHSIHGESTLYFHLLHNNIKTKYIPFRFTRVRENGKEIDDRMRASPELWSSIDGI